SGCCCAATGARRRRSRSSRARAATAAATARCSTTSSAVRATTRWPARRVTATASAACSPATPPPSRRRPAPRSCSATTEPVFSELAPIAAAQLGLYPTLPGPELRARARDAIGVLDLSADDVRVERSWTDGDLYGEELSWSVGFGPRTPGYRLRPRAAGGPLPGAVALHCHAGMKWAGKEKIADGPGEPSPEVRRLRDELYGGRAFANELARRGFVVLAHDVFVWGSRRFPL